MRRTTPGGRAFCFAIAMAALAADTREPLHAQTIRLQPQHDSYRQRVDHAARESLALLTAWLGPIPAQAAPVEVDLPWRSAPSTMDVESAVAFALARRWWPKLAEDVDAPPHVNGLAWYLQTRIVERLYDFAFLNPGHSSDGVRVFGGAFPLEFPLLRMSRWTSGLGRQELIGATPRTWPAPAHRLPRSLDAASIRIAMAFGSIERQIGWPALQGALFVAARRAGSGSLLTVSEFSRTLDAAAGQELSRMLTTALEGHATDYAIASVSTTACATGACVVTRVTTAGTGTGDEIELRLDFADGQSAEARWDGRSATKVFEFESPAPPVGVHLDPNRVVLLDSNRLNNDWIVPSRTNAPIAKWVARWLVWVQDATLSYASLF